jgi:hypothetical protein
MHAGESALRQSQGREGGKREGYTTIHFSIILSMKRLAIPVVVRMVRAVIDDATAQLSRNESEGKQAHNSLRHDGTPLMVSYSFNVTIKRMPAGFCCLSDDRKMTNL